MNESIDCVLVQWGDRRRVAAADPVMLERLGELNQRLNEGIALKRRFVEDLRPSCLDTLGVTIA